MNHGVTSRVSDNLQIVYHVLEIRQIADNVTSKPTTYRGSSSGTIKRIESRVELSRWWWKAELSLKLKSSGKMNDYSWWPTPDSVSLHMQWIMAP